MIPSIIGQHLLEADGPRFCNDVSLISDVVLDPTAFQSGDRESHTGIIG